MADWGEITKIRERHRLTPEGELVKVYRISAVTTKGVPFTHDLEMDELDLDKANEVLRPYAQKLDGLLEL